MSWRDKIRLNKQQQPRKRPQVPRTKSKTCTYKRLRKKRSDGYEDSIKFSEGCTPEDKARIMEGLRRGGDIDEE